MSLIAALDSQAESDLAEYIQQVLPETCAVNVKSLRQTTGEVYTGGRSTPVFKILVDIVPHDEDGVSGTPPREMHLMAKSIHLKHEGPHLDRTDYDSLTFAFKVRSYLIEAGFYGWKPDCDRHLTYPGKACRRAGLTIPEVYSIEFGGSYANASAKSEASICFLMNDLTLTHPVHPTVLSVDQARIALDWLAQFHARFWAAPKLNEEWPGSVVWEEGGFWPLQQCTLRESGSFDSSAIERQWVKTIQWLKRKHPAESDSFSSLAQRMVNCRAALQSILHNENLNELPRLSPVFYEKENARKAFYRPQRLHVTLMHGDFKAANMFFSEKSSKGQNDDLASHCAVCDFQFVGPGLGASDTAYLLFPDPRVQYFDDEGSLLDWYHRRLQYNLRNMEKAEEGECYSRKLLEFHYRCAQIEIFLHLLGRGWIASSENDRLLICTTNAFMLSLDNGDCLDPETYQLRLTCGLEELS